MQSKGSDDIFDTKSLNLADVSSWLICVINLLLRVVDLFSETNFGFTVSLSNPQILHKFAQKICSHFETSWGFIYLVKQSQSFPHEAFHVAAKPTLNSSLKTTGAIIGYKVANNNLRSKEIAVLFESSASFE